MMIRIAVVLLLAGIVLSKKPVLQLCEKPQTDMKCMMMCELTDDTVQPVTIYHGHTEVAACTIEKICIVKDTAYTDSMISWDSRDNMTMIHFSIKSLNITTNEGKWRCCHGSNSCDEKDLKIYSKPTTCHLMKVGDGENATLECHVNCAYPQVQVQLLIDNKATTEMSTNTDGDSANCKYREEKSLTYTWPVTFKSGASYTCECSVAAIGWTSSGMLEKKKDPSGANITIIVAIVAIVVFVIIAIVIAIILIKKRRNAKGGARVPTKDPDEREEL